MCVFNFYLLGTDESYFNDSIEIALPQNVVPGSVYAVVSTVGKSYIVIYTMHSSDILYLERP